ncbi:MAG: hypothetical protein A3H29_04810 [Acidobacteria bacterium RIFCSPLOWO2_02_FULL_67_21]|nr:MAG: hypothetical protein A3H29_04810 [Acidobacteria bacterium RIFCSPLOWO2_02_FULL_67_21]
MTAVIVVWGALAGIAVALHFAFVAFAAAGGLLALRWRWIPWLHVPAAGWAAYIELSGGICPLTPLENDLRARAGLDDYSGDFIARYLFPLLYPAGLTSTAQTALGLTVIILNISVYAWLVRRRTRATA